MKFRTALTGVVATMLVAGGLVLAGCEKPVREARVQPAASPTDAPASAGDDALASTSQPVGDPTPAAAVLPPETTPASAAAAETQPVLTTLVINGVAVQFPPTKLLLHPGKSGKPVTFELFSDLPKSALRQYDGNELYLEMTPTAPEGSTAEKIDGASWRFKAPNSEKIDSPNGIFLSGQTTHLQPFDVLIQFTHHPIDGSAAAGAEGAPLMADIRGQFRAFDANTPNALAPFVGVSGRVPVEVVQKR